jgi:hypothetical protein
MHFDRNAITKMDILQLSKIEEAVRPETSGSVTLDWDPFVQQAFRQPIIAEDCNTYAYLARDNDGDG